MKIGLIVTGAPRTKKNSQRIVRGGRTRGVLPSKAWVEWATHCDIVSMADFTPLDKMLAASPRGYLFPDEALNCKAHFHRDSRVGDAVGYYQGIADLLEKRRVVQNDQQIVSWDQSRLYRAGGAMLPCTFVVLEVVQE